MSNPMKQHGAFSWNELMTSDIDGAKAFYAALFGWKLEDMSSTEDMVYTIAKVGDREVAGMMATPPEAAGKPPSWGAYVTVDDVDASAAKAAELGGNVLVGPQDIPKVGRFCVIQDPQGAVVSMITYSEECVNSAD